MSRSSTNLFILNTGCGLFFCRFFPFNNVDAVVMCPPRSLLAMLSLSFEDFAFNGTEAVGIKRGRHCARNRSFALQYFPTPEGLL